MSIKETLDRDFKQALKSKDEIRVAVLRMVKAAMKNKAVEMRRDLEDADILSVIASQIKQRRDSIQQFQKGGRQDLAEREEKELAFLTDYQPKQLNHDELDAAVDQIMAELGAVTPKDMGRVMKAFMARYQGQADGKMVSEVVKRKIST